MSSRMFSRTLVVALFLGVTVLPWAEAAETRNTGGRAFVILREISSRVALPSLAEFLQGLATKNDRGPCSDQGDDDDRDGNNRLPVRFPGYPGGPSNGDEGSGACPGGGPRR